MTDKEQLEEIKALIRQYFSILDIVEETDDGREFHPNRLGSCRAMDCDRMEKLLIKLKEFTIE